MTRLLSLSRKALEYSSFERFASKSLPGVHVTIRKMSLGRRMELAQQIRQLGARLEFQEAGSGVSDKIEAAVTSAEIDAIYLRWGVVEVEGLTLDRQSPSQEELIARAPEAFIREVIERIKAECGLTGEERKN